MQFGGSYIMYRNTLCHTAHAENILPSKEITFEAVQIYAKGRQFLVLAKDYCFVMDKLNSLHGGKWLPLNYYVY